MQTTTRLALLDRWRVGGPLLLLLGALAPISCQKTALRKEAPRAVIVSKEHLGKTLTVEGRAANAKLGAQLVGDGFTLWIAGLDSWPDGYWVLGQPGKRLRVTGTLIEDHALPVFRADMSRVLTSGEEIPQGILIPPEPELIPDPRLENRGGKGSDPKGTSETSPAIRPASRAERHRFLLRNATWVSLDD